MAATEYNPISDEHLALATLIPEEGYRPACVCGWVGLTVFADSMPTVYDSYNMRIYAGRFTTRWAMAEARTSAMFAASKHVARAVYTVPVRNDLGIIRL